MADTQDFKIWRPGYKAEQIVAWYGKGPRVNTSTNTWEVWDIAQKKYVDTGVKATGEIGDPGPPGPYPELQIGNVTTLPAGSQATARFTGTVENPLLNLGLPRGKDGDGAGDMTKFIYDTQNRQEDIYDYVAKHAPGDNLLVNAYFIGGGSQQGGGQFPINQRGETSYTGNVVTIDRWRINFGATNVKVSLDAGGLSISWVGSGYLSQFFDEATVRALRGKTVTISALVGNTLYSAIAKIPESGAIDTARVQLPNGVYFNIYSQAPNVDIVYARFFASAGCSVQNIKAMKLELGSQQTLAHKEGDTWVLNDPPPNFQQELAKCQRYMINLAPAYYNGWLPIGMGLARNTKRAYIYIPLTVTLRTHPTIETTGSYILTATGGSDVGIEVEKIQSIGIISNTILTVAADVLNSSLTLNQCYILECNNSAGDRSFIINANL